MVLNVKKSSYKKINFSSFKNFFFNFLILLKPFSVYLSAILLCIIGFIHLLLYYYIYPHIHPFIFYIGTLVYLTQNLSQIYTTIVNPGMPRISTHTPNEIDDSTITCNRCNAISSNTTVITHCDQCNVCVEGNTYSFK